MDPENIEKKQQSSYTARDEPIEKSQIDKKNLLTDSLSIDKSNASSKLKSLTKSSLSKRKKASSHGDPIDELCKKRLKRKVKSAKKGGAANIISSSECNKKQDTNEYKTAHSVSSRTLDSIPSEMQDSPFASQVVPVARPTPISRPTTRHHLIDLHGLAIFLHNTTRCFNCYAGNCLLMMGNISHQYPPSVTRINLKCQNCGYSVDRDLVHPKLAAANINQENAVPISKNRTPGREKEIATSDLEKDNSSHKSEHYSESNNDDQIDSKENSSLLPTSSLNNQQYLPMYPPKVPFYTLRQSVSPMVKSFLSPENTGELVPKGNLKPHQFNYSYVQTTKPSESKSSLDCLKFKNDTFRHYSYLKSNIQTSELERWIVQSDKMLSSLSESVVPDKEPTATKEEKTKYKLNADESPSTFHSLREKHHQLYVKTQANLRDSAIISKLLNLTEALKMELIERAKEIQHFPTKNHAETIENIEISNVKEEIEKKSEENSNETQHSAIKCELPNDIRNTENNMSGSANDDQSSSQSPSSTSNLVIYKEVSDEEPRFEDCNVVCQNISTDNTIQESDRLDEELGNSPKKLEIDENSSETCWRFHDLISSDSDSSDADSSICPSQKFN